MGLVGETERVLDHVGPGMAFLRIFSAASSIRRHMQNREGSDPGTRAHSFRAKSRSRSILYYSPVEG